MVGLTISCSKDDDSSSNSLSVEIVLTEGRASYMEITPIDKEIMYEAKDVKEYENVDQVSFVLPDYTYYFKLDIQGNQSELQGYVKINGETQKFTVPDWYYSGSFYLDDFK